MKSIAAELRLPQVLVDARHESTHGALPSLAVLERCRTEALAWLQEHYWRGDDSSQQQQQQQQQQEQEQEQEQETKQEDKVDRLRRGDYVPLEVRVDDGALQQLVALRSKRPAPVTSIDEPDPLHLLPSVPRWDSDQVDHNKKKTKVMAIKAAVSF